MTHTPEPWEVPVSEVLEQVKSAIAPVAQQAADDIYSRLLETTQDYLVENALYNIGQRIATAECQAAHDRAVVRELVEALRRAENYIANTESELGVTLESGEMARAALAKAGAA